MRRPEEALQNIQEIDTMIEQGQDVGPITVYDCSYASCRVLAGQSVQCYNSGDLDSARKLAKKCIKAGKQALVGLTGDAKRDSVNFDMAGSSNILGKPKEAENILNEVLNNISFPNGLEAAKVLIELSKLHLNGDAAVGLKYARKALVISRLINESQLEKTALFYCINHLFTLRRLREMYSRVEQLCSLSRTLEGGKGILKRMLFMESTNALCDFLTANNARRLRKSAVKNRYAATLWSIRSKYELTAEENEIMSLAEVKRGRQCSVSKVCSLMRCRGCQIVEYCSVECSELDVDHSKVCETQKEGASQGRQTMSVCSKMRVLKLCVGCNVAEYCSSKCAKADWKKHKKVCDFKKNSK